MKRTMNMNKKHPYNIDSEPKDEQWMHNIKSTPTLEDDYDKVEKAKKILGIE